MFVETKGAIPINTDDLSVNERRDLIVEMLNVDGKVKVSVLSQLFSTSDVTIRGDLNFLEKRGVLHRIHGGAIKAEDPYTQYTTLNFNDRKAKNMVEKEAIARAAASLVSDGQIIFLNSGSTTYYLARELKTKDNLTIVTNSLSIANELQLCKQHRVVLLGGIVNPYYAFVHGDDTILQLKRYKADIAFLCADGFTAMNGVTVYHPEEAALSRTMIERSYSTVVIADYKKIGRESFVKVADTQLIDKLVTNLVANLDEIAAISKAGVEIMQV